ncbi:MAG: hypothetical protein GC149_18755 [Gammaproteobacteria bacterium]|nr:hypothetical protein [Gammaproteobacteria bacterium]
MESTLERLNNHFTQFTEAFYSKFTPDDDHATFSNIQQLAQYAEANINSGDEITAISSIMRNKKLIAGNINSKAIIRITGFLLDAYEKRVADNIFKKARQESDPSLVSNTQFEFAKYHFSKNEWQETINIIGKIANDLPEKEYQHALFMEGMSYQKLLHHREALSIYQKVTESSEYYPVTRINMAVSDFRQGWWTDAHAIILNLLKTPTVSENTDFKDRLNTMLGYSFLQLEYYRNSRDAFRNVSLNSQYTNKALLGIALDAAYQADYTGAINAAEMLKNSGRNSLEKDEAYLLLPYFHEKAGQYSVATAGYNQAIVYYEARLHSLSTYNRQDIDFYIKILDSKQPDRFTIHDEGIDLEDRLPRSYFGQLHLINQYRAKVPPMQSDALTTRLRQLTAEYAELMKSETDAILAERVQYITDYMNQARYGIARLYDNSRANTDITK